MCIHLYNKPIIPFRPCEDSDVDDDETLGGAHPAEPIGRGVYRRLLLLLYNIIFYIITMIRPNAMNVVK